MDKESGKGLILTELDFPEGMVKEDAQDLIKLVRFSPRAQCKPWLTTQWPQLLQANPAKRIGTNPDMDIKKHSFFSSIDWNALIAGKVKAPFIPSVRAH